LKITYRLQTIFQSSTCICGDYHLILNGRFIKFSSFIWIHDYPSQLLILNFYFRTGILNTFIMLYHLLFVIKDLLINAEYRVRSRLLMLMLNFHIILVLQSTLRLLRLILIDIVPQLVGILHLLLVIWGSKIYIVQISLLNYLHRIVVTIVLSSPWFLTMLYILEGITHSWLLIQISELISLNSELTFAVQCWIKIISFYLIRNKFLFRNKTIMSIFI